MKSKKQILSFITENQNKYAYLKLCDNVIDVHQLRQSEFLILQNNQLSQLILPRQIKLVIQLDKSAILLDKIVNPDQIIYLMQTENDLYLLIYTIVNQQAKLIKRETNINVKVIELINTDELILNGIALKNEQMYLVTQGQFDTSIDLFEELTQVQGMERINSRILVILAQQTFYEINNTMEIQECLSLQVSQLKQASQINDFKYILTDSMLIKYDNETQVIYQCNCIGFTEYSNECYIYYYDDNKDLCIQQLECDQILKIQFDKIVNKLWIINQSALLIIDQNNELYLLFQPDYRSVLSQYFNLEEFNNKEVLPKEIPQILQKPSQEYLISLNKNIRTRQNIDEMISISLKYSYIQLLLLMCARIRVFYQFFNHVKKMSDNGNEKELRDLLDMKKLKKCECVEGDLVMEELVEECLKHSNHRIFIYFQKLFLENPEYINNQNYLNILACKCDRQLYLLANLSVPIIPNSAFKRQANYIQFLQKAKLNFIKDLYENKEKSLQIIKRGMIGNAMQCYECLKPIQYSKKVQENKIIKYFECYHAVHSKCWQVQHNCNEIQNHKKYL